MDPFVMLRIAILLAGLLLPPILGLVCILRGWKSRGTSPTWKRTSPVVLGAGALVNWVLFVTYLATDQIGGVGFDYHISRVAGLLLLFSLLSVLVSIGAHGYRRSLLIANILLLTLWFGIAYAPEHWLARDDFGVVKLDDHRVPAAVYIGNPRRSEAEAIVLVHVPSMGDYVLDFGEETFREASKREFLALPYGAWAWKPMTHGEFRPPLPSRNFNEFRIPLAGGRVVTIAF